MWTRPEVRKVQKQTGWDFCRLFNRATNRQRGRKLPSSHYLLILIELTIICLNL